MFFISRGDLFQTNDDSLDTAARVVLTPVHNWYQLDSKLLSYQLAVPDSKVHGAKMGPSGADRTQGGPCWPHEICYLGSVTLVRFEGMTFRNFIFFFIFIALYPFNNAGQLSFPVSIRKKDVLCIRTKYSFGCIPSADNFPNSKYRTLAYQMA